MFEALLQFLFFLITSFFFFCKLLAYVKKNHEYCERFVRSVAAYLRIVIACVQYRTFAVCFCET